MIKAFLRFPPIKFALLLALLLALSACGSAAKQPVHPYIKDIRDIEIQALNAVEKNRFRSAYHYSSEAYRAYAAIDFASGMARNLINQAQIALLVEDLNRAELALGVLQSLIERKQLTNLRERALILNVNLAIAKQDWAEAQATMDRLSTPEAKQNLALRESIIVARQLIQWGIGRSPEFSNDLSLPLMRARQLRLESEVALADGNHQLALSRVTAAKKLYQAETFTPGVAECLVLEAKLSDDEERRRRLREQARLVFSSIQNARAIKRHGL